MSQLEKTINEKVTKQKTYTKEQLTQDLDNIIPYLEEVHPNPFTIISKKEIEDKIELVKEKLSDKMSSFDFFYQVSPIISSLGDGHTGLSFPSDEFKELDPYVFPLKLEFKNNKIYTLDNQTELPVGTEILNINQKTSLQITNDLLATISGENNSFRLILLSGMFSALFEYSKSYLVEYICGESSKTITLKGIRFSELINKKTKKQTEESNNYSYSFIENKTVLFDFKAFVDYEKFTKFLKPMFQGIKDENVQNLIIDIRENGGGNSHLGTELMQYISKKPFCHFGKEIIKYSKKRKEFYDNDMKNGILSYLSDKEYQDLFKHKNGSLITEDDSKLEELRENDLRFLGNVYLLTSNYTFSSATDLAYTFQNFEVGKIIGEKTGGNIVSFGDIINTHLPNTNLLLYISHQEFYGYEATEKDRRPVSPDYEVEKDDALEFTLKMIKNNF